MNNLELISLYKSLYLIRHVEEMISKNYSKGQMRCPVHLSIGQEACATGLISNLKLTDKVFSNHRCHAHYLAKGGSLKKMLCEIYGKKNGCVGGVGGSMHLQDLDKGLVASIPIVSSSIGMATGNALYQKRNKSNQVTVIYLGDAALEEGIFFECANFAALHSLPIIFACENNLFSVYTNLKDRQLDSNFKKYADAYNIPYKRLDGSRIDEVYKKTKSIINFVRKNKMPYFIQMDTYRFKEHCGPAVDDHLEYRDQKEVSYWKKKCPIEYAKKLMKRKKISDNKIKTIEKNIEKLVIKDFIFAERDKLPNYRDADRFVYV